MMRCLTMAALMGWLTLLLTGCYEPVPDNSDSESDGPAVLKVRVIGHDDQLQYPVSLLVFSDYGKLETHKVMSQPDVPVSLQLPKADYTVVALSGTAGWAVPGSWTHQSFITSFESNAAFTPLYIGRAQVQLQSSQMVLNLRVYPQTAALSATLTEVPSDVSEVRMWLGSIYTGIGLKGNLSVPSLVKVSFQKQSASTWSLPDPVYLLPSAGSIVDFTIDYLHDDLHTSSYSYTSQHALQAGYHYSYRSTLNGGLQEVGVTGNGTVPFDDPTAGGTGSGDDNPTSPSLSIDTICVSSLPSAPSCYEGWAVASIVSEAADCCNALLLSVNEWDQVLSANSESPSDALAKAESYTENGQRGWRIPTKEEANLLKRLYGGDNLYIINNVLAQAGGMPLLVNDGKNKSVRYLCNEAQHTFSFSASTGNNSQAGSKTYYHLRLVKEVCFSLSSR